MFLGGEQRQKIMSREWLCGGILHATLVDLAGYISLSTAVLQMVNLGLFTYQRNIS